MKTDQVKVLAYCYGNPGRLDDGLGPAFADRLEQLDLPGVDVDCNYQLQVEDAETIAQYDVVVFIDASVDGPEPFFCRPLQPTEEACSFTTHHLAPEQVLYLANTLFQASAKAYVLGIRGYDYNEFGEYLSDRAKQNLEQALDFFRTTWEDGWG